MTKHKGIRRRLVELAISAGATLMFMYWASTSSGAIVWLFIAASVAAMLSVFSDVRGLADEFDRGSEYAPEYQDGYRELWIQARTRENDLREALIVTNAWIERVADYGIGFEHVEDARERVAHNRDILDGLGT